MTKPPRVPDEVAARIVSPAAHTERAALCADLRWLRANDPVGLVEAEGFDPFWLVTRHDDVARVGRENEGFVSSARPVIVTARAEEATMRARTGRPYLMRFLINRDAPDHRDHRRVIQGWFTPQRMKALAAAIQAVARSAADHMLSLDGRCDFVEAVSLRYPLRVLMGIIGVPAGDEDFLLKVTREIFGARDRHLSDDAATFATEARAIVEGRAAAYREVAAYFASLTAARRRRPTDDLATAIAGARIDGAPLTDADALALYVIVLTAGHDTTSAATAGAIWGLCETPAELDKVRADPGLVPGLVEEAVRWTSPVSHFMRSASRAASLGGRAIAPGDWLMMSYLSANRDEALFADPDAFRVDRPATSQVAFGGGAHACLGQHLARMEMRILFAELLPRLRSLALAGTPTRSSTVFVGGPSSLPIRFDPR